LIHPWILYGAAFGVNCYVFFMFLTERKLRKQATSRYEELLDQLNCISFDNQQEAEHFMESLIKPQTEESKERARTAIEFLKRARERQ